MIIEHAHTLKHTHTHTVLIACVFQIVVGTVLSVQMDLSGQHRVQVVGHIPSGSVQQGP